ncbi:hypothetical protein [Lacunimicrobium album]
MNVNRLLPAVVSASVLFVACLFVVPALSQDKLGHNHNDGHDPKQATAKIEAALAELPKTDRSQADAQRYCPVMDTVRLGAMGTPVKAMIEGKPVFLCCEGCQDEAAEKGKETLAKAQKLKRATASLAKLPAADQPLAESQLFCAVAEGSRLGSMGTPVKLMLEGKPVFLCCKGCEASAHAHVQETLAKVEEIKKANAKAAHHDEDKQGQRPVLKK